MRLTVPFILTLILLIACTSAPNLPQLPGLISPFGEATNAIESDTFHQTTQLPDYLARYSQPNMVEGFSVNPNPLPIKEGTKIKIKYEDDYVAPFGLIVMRPYHWAVYYLEGQESQGWLRGKGATELEINEKISDKLEILGYSCTILRKNNEFSGYDCHNSRWQSIEVELFNSECEQDELGCIDNVRWWCQNNKKQYNECEDNCNAGKCIVEELSGLPPGFELEPS